MSIKALAQRIAALSKAIEETTSHHYSERSAIDTLARRVLDDESEIPSNITECVTYATLMSKGWEEQAKALKAMTGAAAEEQAEKAEAEAITKAAETFI